jgi:hypothetical protein
MDDTSGIAKLTEYGEKLGHKILNDDWDKMPEPLKPIVLGDSAALASN